MKAPSSKISFLLIIVVLIVSGTITYSIIKEKEGSFEKSETDKIATLSIGRSTSGAQLFDTDEDGLPDWEEELWRTDKNNPDTDGDGTKDGEEIKLNRNPLIKAPGDEITADTQVNMVNSVIYEDFVPGTLSDNLSKNLASNYLTLKQSGDLSEESQVELINSITNDIAEITEEEIKYTISDVHIVTNSKENIKQYGNDFGQLQMKYATILANLDIENDSEYINAFAKAYLEFSLELLKINVPESISKTHLQITNNLYNTNVSIIELDKYKEDPVRALLAIKKSQKVETQQPQLYVTLAEYFKSNAIIFNENESGKIWNNL